MISLKGDLDYQRGHFTTGNLGKSKFIFNGDKWQKVTGKDFTPVNCIFNMTVNNPEGVELHNNMFVHNTIEFIQGVINSGDYEGLLTLDNAEPDCIFGFGSESYVDGPNFIVLLLFRIPTPTVLFIGLLDIITILPMNGRVSKITFCRYLTTNIGASILKAKLIRLRFLPVGMAFRP